MTAQARLVKDLRTNRMTRLPKAKGGNCCVSCGSQSALSAKKKGNNANNMAEHISGKDVIRLINLYDDPLFSEVAQLTLEHVSDFDADETLSIASALRNALSLKCVNSISTIMKALLHGGPGARDRFYESENKASEELGAFD